MQESPESIRELISKLVMLIPGIIIGVATKLSKLNRDRALTWRDAIYCTCVAFSSGIMVYYILDYYNLLAWTIPAMLICGRYGDEILIFIWKWVRSSLNTLIKKQ